MYFDTKAAAMTFWLVAAYALTATVLFVFHPKENEAIVEQRTWPQICNQWSRPFVSEQVWEQHVVCEGCMSQHGLLFPARADGRCYAQDQNNPPTPEQLRQAVCAQSANTGECNDIEPWGAP